MTVRAVVRRLVPRPARNWLRSPLGSLRWVLDEAKHAAGRDPTVRLRADWPLVCHPAAYRLAYHAQRHDPEQTRELDAFVRHCREDMILFDLGAHFGLFSLAALHYGGAGARAVAVDPSPTAVRMIGIQSRLNRAEGRLAVVPAAVGRRSGSIEMLPVGVIAAGYYTVDSDPDRPPSEKTRVRTVTVDELVAAHHVRPTHVKIDVEGFEADVLAGGRHTLTGPEAPQLFVELHNRMIENCGRDPNDVLSLLSDFGYQTFDTADAPLSPSAATEPALVRFVARKAYHPRPSPAGDR